VDPQLYRDVEISIPRERTPDQRVSVVQGFVRDQFVSMVMVADNLPKAHLHFAVLGYNRHIVPEVRR
jgi:hypothetical protein